jgi:hypothetical protein
LQFEINVTEGKATIEEKKPCMVSEIIGKKTPDAILKNI